MKRLDYYKEQWQEFIDNIDFTDEELAIINLARKGWYQEDIAAELHTSRRTVARRYTSIDNKIVHYVLEVKQCHIHGTL